MTCVPVGCIVASYKEPVEDNYGGNNRSFFELFGTVSTSISQSGRETRVQKMLRKV